MPKYIINKHTGEVLIQADEVNHEIDEMHEEVISDPKIAKGTNLDGHLIYKRKKLHNCTEKDLVKIEKILIDKKKEIAIEGAQKFMEITGDTAISASALIKAIHGQLSRLEKGRPIETFEEMMSDYEDQVENWSDASKKIRFC